MDRPEIILAPGPTPIPPEVLLAQGSPLVYHRGPGFGRLMRDVTGAPQGAVPHRARRRAADDLQRHRRARVRDPNFFSPGRRGLRPARGVLLRAVAKLAAAYGLTVRTVEYEWGTKVDPPRSPRARGAPGEGGAAHAVGDLDRRDPADRGARAGRQRRRRAGDRRRRVAASAPCRSRSTTGASTWRSAGRRRRCRRRPGIAFVAISERAWEAHAERHATRGSTSTGRPTAVRRPPRPREPVDARDQRDAGAARRARAVLPGRRRRRVSATRDALARGEGGREGARASTCSARASSDNWTVTAIRAPEGIDADTISDRIRSDFGCVLAPGQGPLKGKVFRIGHFGYFSELDIIRGLAALEMTLERLGSPGEARRGGRGGRGRLPGARAGCVGMRVLVTEKLSEAGLELLRKDFQVDVRPDLATRRPRRRDRAVRRARHPERDAGDRRGPRRRAAT